MADLQGSGATLTAVIPPPWMDRFAYAVAYCETRANYRHRSGDLEGAWGWRHTTWLMDRYPGMPAYAFQATARQQYRVFRRSLRRGRDFGCITHGGYRVWM